MARYFVTFGRTLALFDGFVDSTAGLLPKVEILSKYRTGQYQTSDPKTGVQRVPRSQLGLTQDKKIHGI